MRNNKRSISAQNPKKLQTYKKNWPKNAKFKHEGESRGQVFSANIKILGQAGGQTYQEILIIYMDKSFTIARV